MKDIIISWSGGKDCAYALYSIMQTDKYNIRGLFSTTTKESERLPAHEVHNSLIQEQAKSLQLPFYELQLPHKPSNEVYEQMVGEKFREFKKMGIDTICYADLLLEDMRAYRDQLLERYEMKGLYPLWKKGTLQAAEDFINHGFKAIVITIDTSKLSLDILGKNFDKEFIKTLPNEVDPSGENGEYHTYVYDGPIFHYPIEVETGEIFETESFGGQYAHVEVIFNKG